MAGHITVEARGDVALVRVDRPPANALDPDLLAEAIATLDAVAAAEPAAVVLTGREGFFSAGADLKLTPTLDAAGQRAMVDGINGMAAGWYGFPRPVVGAINGHAIAGGLVLALCADYRVGATDGQLGLTEVRAGIPYPAVAMAVVRAELSPPVARDLVLRGRLVDPATALGLGLLDELAEPGAVVDRALAVAVEMAELPREAFAFVKGQLRGETLAAAQRALEGEGDPLNRAWLGQETVEAAARTLRDPAHRA